MKKSLLWLAAILISFSPLYLLYVNETPNVEIGLFTVFVATFLLMFSDYRFEMGSKTSIFLLIPSLIVAFLLDFPFNIGFIMLSIAIILNIALSYVGILEKIQKLVSGIFLSGILLLIVYAFYPLYSVIFSRYHRVGILNNLFSGLLHLFGIQSSVNNNLIYIQTYNQTFPFTVTWEKLCILIWLNLFLIFLFISFLSFNKKRFLRNLGIFILIALFYSVFRLLLTTIIYSQNSKLSTFWDTNLALLTFIPLFIPLSLLIKTNEVKIDMSFGKTNKKTSVTMLTLFLSIFFLIGSIAFEDPGIRKSGKILIDEVHSDWEDTTREMDKEWYGMLSTYNYYCWAKWLDIYYDVDINTNKSLTYDLLKNYDILIIKCPTDLFSNREINDILKFVRDGGGLYLIGDHTNVFGMNFYLNQISKKLGIEFKTDATYELNTGSLSVYKPPSLFAHPIVKNINKFEFQTSCSLNAPLFSENVIIGYGLLGEPGTYSTENFFREPLSSPDVEYGLLLQTVALQYGKGRVVAFTDSTCFSNFCVFMDGYREFNLGVIEYLNRINAYNYINTLFVIAFIILLVASIILIKEEKVGKIVSIFFFSTSIAFATSAPLFDYINSINYELPSIEEHPIVCFDMEHSEIEISPSAQMEFYSSADTYNTFFVWTQRVGWMPSVEKTIEKSIEKGDAVIIINPNKSFSDGEIEKIRKYVEEGGRLLVLDSIRNKDSTANQILNTFNMELSTETSNLSLRCDNSSIGNITIPYLSIIGGDVNFSFNNNTYISIKEFGEGKIVAIVDSYTFSDEVMGDVFTEPDEKLRAIYDVEYYIFEKIL